MNERKWLGERTYDRIGSYQTLVQVNEVIRTALANPNWASLYIQIVERYGDNEIHIVGKLLETQEEADERVARETKLAEDIKINKKNSAKAQEEKDRKLYEKLKAQFEGKPGNE